jgi:hypothetical protein
MLTLVATALAAHAQERAVFVAKIPPIRSWCGDRAVILAGDHAPTWFDVFDKRRIRLQVTKLDVWFSECSPDGRWVLGREGPMGGEGGDPGCNPKDQTSFPRVLLWDTKTRTSYAIGNGFFAFSWSADGKTLLYHPWPYCDIETHPRTRLRWPAGIREFQPISMRALLAQAFADVSGWVDDGRIGAIGWIDSGKFVVQLRDGEGNALWDVTPDGAIVMIELADGRIRRAVQLHPSVPRPGDLNTFKTTRLFNIPQLAERSSDDILRAAGCKMIGEGMGCITQYDPEVEQIRTNMARYCAALTEKNSELCARATKDEHLGRLRRGGTVLLLKSAGGAIDKLFRVEHDQGGYLK